MADSRLLGESSVRHMLIDLSETLRQKADELPADSYSQQPEDLRGWLCVSAIPIM